ncbi:hypothetical protein M885DRAFT_521146 [Pelagophyceae sp. CCMP2097]|nr:hypothetical protein M885DRAFT_521146 [Pelagophyceae sp. CCMP2097]
MELFASLRASAPVRGAIEIVLTPQGQMVAAAMVVLMTWAILTKRVYVISWARSEAVRTPEVARKHSIAVDATLREEDRRRANDVSDADAGDDAPAGNTSLRKRTGSTGAPMTPQEHAETVGSSKYDSLGRLMPRAGCYWSEPDATGFKLRGPSYLMDKVKVACGPPLFRLLDCDLLELEQPKFHIAEHLTQRIGGLVDASKAVDPFVCVIQLQVPGPPFKTFVMYFLCDDRKRIFDEETAFSTLARRFFAPVDSPDGSAAGADAVAADQALYKWRNNTFKLIPRCVNAPFVVKRAVGEVPTLLGNKVQQCYFGPKHGKYFEVDINVSSSRIAQYTIGLAINYASAVVADLAFVLQGAAVSELPESLFGTVRIEHIVMRDATRLDIPA